MNFKGDAMTNWGRALRKGAKAFRESLSPGEYSAGGQKVICGQCGGSIFETGSSQLNSAGLTFAGLDWADKSAATLACVKCGKILWFLKKPEKLYQT